MNSKLQADFSLTFCSFLAVRFSIAAVLMTFFRP